MFWFIFQKYLSWAFSNGVVIYLLFIWADWIRLKDYVTGMESEVEMTRTRLASGSESINSVGADPTSMELESDASTASLQQQQQQQQIQQQEQQQRKLWRSKSTVRSELSVEAGNNAVTNEELKELKQWFQVISLSHPFTWSLRRNRRHLHKSTCVRRYSAD